MENQRRKIALREKLKKRAADDIARSKFLQTSIAYAPYIKVIAALTVFAFIVGISLCILHFIAEQ